jgi:hypothetical protein
MSSADAAAEAMAGVARALRELVHVPAKASLGASDSIAKLIDQQFDTGTDPYGRAWKPLKASTIKRKGHARIGVDSGAMQRGIDVRPMSGAGVQISVDEDYAPYFSRRRALFPNKGLPATWRAAIASALAESASAVAERTGGEGNIIDQAAE